MWEKIVAVSDLLSVVISVVALLVAKSGADRSTSIANEALQTARQSNDIALGRLREPPVVEIYSYDMILDFTDSEILKEELKVKISIRNPGKVAIDGLSMELIGIKPFTYPEHNPDNAIHPLPSIKVNVGLDTIIQPGGAAHIDMRIPILQYLVKLAELINQEKIIYRTAINIVLKPKAIGDPLPSKVLSSDTMNDRKLIVVRFHPDILHLPTVEQLLNKQSISHRVYSP